MKTIQRLNNSQALKAVDTATGNELAVTTVQNAGWEIISGPASISISGDNYFALDYYVLNLNVTGPGPIVLRLAFDAQNSPFLNTNSSDTDLGQSFVFSCVMNCSNGSPVVQAKLCDLNGACDQSNTRTLVGSLWDAVRSNTMVLETLDYNANDYAITLTISGHSPNYITSGDNAGQGLSKILISTPNLVNDSVWANNPVIQNMRPYLPDLYQSYDSQETDPTYPFFRLVDVLTDSIADTMFLYSEWFQHYKYELPANFGVNDLSTRSRLTDPNNVRSEYLDWVGQFSGNKVIKQIYNSSSQAIVTDTDLFKVKQLKPAIYGTGSGKKSSVVTAAQFGLSGTKKVSVSAGYNASPWNILVSTLGSETLDVDYRGTVKVATTAQITISTALNAGDVIDGITLVAGDRVLVKNQTSAGTTHQNGVYVVSASPSRSLDFDTGWNGTTGEIKQGATFVVTQGTVNADKTFQMTTSGNITIGTTAIAFSAFAGSENILLLVENVRPMGYKIYHNVVNQFTLKLGDSTYGVLDTAVL
jgi:hypothetical protein